MVLVRAGFRGERNHALSATVLSGEIVVNDADFLQSFRVGQDRCFVEASAHNRKSVELNIVLERTSAVDPISRELGAARYSYAKGTDRGAVEGIVTRLHPVLQSGVEKRILRNVRQCVNHLRTGSA